MNRFTHTIAPVFNEESRILILGSFPSPKSREVGFYYGHPQNRFWSVLSIVLNEPCPKTPEEKQMLLFKHHIALWDVLHSCDISGASDSSIKNPVPNDLQRIFDVADIRAVFTTGKTAGKLFKRFTGCESVILPSPSPANCAVSFDQLTEAYRCILPYLTD